MRQLSSKAIGRGKGGAFIKADSKQIDGFVDRNVKVSQRCDHDRVQSPEKSTPTRAGRGQSSERGRAGMERTRTPTALLSATIKAFADDSNVLETSGLATVRGTLLPNRSMTKLVASSTGVSTGDFGTSGAYGWNSIR